MSQAPTPDMDDRIPTLTTEISELDDLVETPAPPAPTADIDPALVLELQERGHRQLLAMPLSYWPLTIGRAATADLVLTDPSIAPEQIRLNRLPDGAVEVEVLDAVNGVWLGKRRYRVGERFTWPVGSKLTVGRGLVLNLRGSQQPLPATVRWRPSSRWLGVTTTLALLALVAMAALVSWLSANKSGAVLRELPTSLMAVGGVLLVWSLVWAIISKLFTGVTSFWRHVCIAAVTAVVWTALEAALSAAAFSFSLPVLTRYTSVLNLVVGAVMLWFHLRAATYVRGRTLAWILGALLVLVCGTKLGLQWQSQKQLRDTMYMSTILPPQWRLAPTVPVDQFMQGTASLRDALDQRAKDKEGEDEADGDDDGLD